MQHHLFSRLQWLAVALVLVITGLSAYYWMGLLHGHEQLKTDRLASANRRALQLADAKASELDALIRGLDASLRQFRDGYVVSGRDAAAAVAESAIGAFPHGAIPFISIIDDQGNVTYSTATTQPMYVGDRDYFRRHQGNRIDRLEISQPLAGKRDGSWVVVLTRPILKRQQFAGVVTVALSIDFLANRLAQLEIGQNDVINVFFADGSYLARSRDWLEVMGKALPADRPFLARSADASGVFSTTAMVDQYRRIYAWRRLDSYPLVLAIGLAEADLFDPVDQAVAVSLRNNAVATVSGLLLVYVIAWLWVKYARQQNRLLENKALLRLTLDSTYDGIVVVDEIDHVLDANRHFFELWDLPPDAFSEPGHAYFEKIYEKMADPQGFRQARQAQDGGDTKRFDAVELKSGKILEGYKRILDLNGHKIRLWCFRDITERKRFEAELQALATTDELTGLSNRRHFVSRLQEEIARIQRMGDYASSVLMLDVDYFKKINDTHGHIAGDQVLREFAEVLRRNLRKIDMPGRLGGEEFAVILPGTSAEAAKHQAERLCLEIRRAPFVTQAAAIPVTVSIGVTAIQASDEAFDTVLGRADHALYQAKQNGRNRVELA
jgi:diguanylate cyclase (GGDEF)-like protein